MNRLTVILCTLALVLGALSSVALATSIPITSVVAPNSNILNPYNTIDGIVGNAPAATGMWLASGDYGVNIQWYFDKEYTLDRAHIWNYNQNDPTYAAANPTLTPFTNRGIQTLAIFVLDGSGWHQFGTTLFNFNIASGDANYAGFDFIFGGVQAQAVSFWIHDNFAPDSHGNFVGLSEIQFNAVPEPGTLLLLGSGLAGLGILGRRRKKLHN